MSATIVSSKHINALLNFIVRDETQPRLTLGDGRVIAFKQAADLDFCAVLLTHQAYASFNRYYQSAYPEPAAAFTFDPTVYSAVEIVKACDGYDYQACETKDYFYSDAAKIVALIRGRAIGAMPEYRAAQTWSIA